MYFDLIYLYLVISQWNICNSGPIRYRLARTIFWKITPTCWVNDYRVLSVLWSNQHVSPKIRKLFSLILNSFKKQNDRTIFTLLYVKIIALCFKTINLSSMNFHQVEVDSINGLAYLTLTFLLKTFNAEDVVPLLFFFIIGK